MSLRLYHSCLGKSLMPKASKWGISSRGHRELLNRRLCRPDFEQWPWTSNLFTMTIVKLYWHNFTQSTYFVIFLCLVFLIDLLTYPYQKNFPKMLVFQIVTSCPLSILSRRSWCPRLSISYFLKDGIWFCSEVSKIYFTNYPWNNAFSDMKKKIA